MAESQNDIVTEEDVNNIDKNLEKMALNMHEFFSNIRDLYTKQAADNESGVGEKFIEIRDDTRLDAMVYLRCILPVTTNLIKSIERYFQIYDALSYEDWCEMMPGITQETATLKDVAHGVLDMHQNMIILLKKREQEAKELGAKYIELESQYKKECEEYKNKKKRQKRWAYALAPIPGVNFISLPLFKSARKNKSLAVAAKNNSENYQNAAKTVDGILIPALQGFVTGLEKVAGFLEIVEQSLRVEENKLCAKGLHYKLMNKKAKDVTERCHAFFQVLPAIRTDFEALPSEDTDQNYVHEWLEKALEDYRVKSTEEAYSNFLSVGMEGIAKYKLPIKPAPPDEQSRKQPEIPTSSKHGGLERKQLEIPTQPDHDGQGRKQQEIPTQPDHDGEERKQQEIPAQPDHDGQERKQQEIPTQPDHDGQEKTQREIPTRPDHDGQEKHALPEHAEQERKQSEIPTSSKHSGQEENN